MNPITRFVEQELAGWGRYPRGVARVYRPEKVGAAVEIAGRAGSLSRLGRGLGRSYGDAALNSGNEVIVSRRLDRFLNFDPASGALTCEAGVSLADVINVFLPKGWFLPVTPGTRHASVGGVVAADVHGKNHHLEGSFSNHLDWIELALADGSVARCSQRENPDLFWATVGGMGLTGLILAARFRLKPVETAFLRVDCHRSPELDETMRLMVEEDHNYLYSVAWIDCLASGRSLGRSVLMRGNPCRLDELDSKRRRSPREDVSAKLFNFPVDLPGFVLNRFSIRALNGCYYRLFRKGRSTKIQSFAPFFYPLDVVGSWNRAYGKRGFVQYQCAFPPDTSSSALRRMLERISAARRGSFLAVLKRLGPETGLLSFPMPGFTLALDFPMVGPDLLAFLDELDEIVLQYRGRVYLAKDARLSPRSFRRMYPRFPAWLEIKRRVDPESRFASDLSRRLRLHEETA